jgi:hypothetical protein
MRRNRIVWTGIFAVWFGLAQVFGQVLSEQQVRYMLTYNAPQNEYTAWVVPGYNTPNANNPETQERGATAQFTLRVPVAFNLTELVDVKGQWEKKPFKLLPVAGSNPDVAYYVIGKAAQETNYGEFRQGEPVALFRFRGQGSTSETISVLAPTDPIINLADKVLSFNINNSFYSRSGQRSNTAARPLEQFKGIATVASVMAGLDKSPVSGAGAASVLPLDESPVVAYPNPTTDELQVKFFSTVSHVNTELDVIDSRGSRVHQQAIKTEVGLNKAIISLKGVVGGNYYIKLRRDNQETVKPINKL